MQSSPFFVSLRFKENAALKTRTKFTLFCSLYTRHTPFTDIREEGTRDEDEHSEENANDRETQRVPGDPVPIHGT